MHSSAPARRRKRWPWITLVVAVVVLVPTAILAVPIFTHVDKGLSAQQPSAVQWPLTASAVGDDGRTRTLSVALPDGSAPDTSALTAGEKLVVTGAGYDGTQGIYVAICVIPADPTIKPGPCIGGVPEQEKQTVDAGAVQYAPSNWINDDWAWKLFGARSFDDISAGTFTAYIEVGTPTADGIDCTVDACGLFTRNDHTALRDRVQDVYLPIGFAASSP